METFLRTRDGRLRGLRICACLYLVIVVMNLIVDGWRSLNWIASLLLSFGFFAMSEAKENAQSRGAKWSSPLFVVGLAAALLALGLMIYRFVARYFVSA